MPNLTEPDELTRERKIGREPTVLDLRSPEEVAAGHVPGAVNIPVGEVEGGARRRAFAGARVRRSSPERGLSRLAGAEPRSRRGQG